MSVQKPITSKQPTVPKLKVYVVGRSVGYANWITDSENLVNTIEEADLVLLTGGEDVNPEYYNEPVHPKTSFTKRDDHEFEEIKKAIALEKPLYGTCRGLQILTVAAGGSLIQDQSNKYSPHLTADLVNPNLENFKAEYLDKITPNLNVGDYISYLSKFPDIDENKFAKILLLDTTQIPLLTTSAHHQAAYPYNMPKNEYNILTWTKGLHSRHEDGNMEEMDIPEEIEIEAAIYYKIKAFGIQGHPEWMNKDCQQEIKNYKNVVEKASLFIKELEAAILASIPANEDSVLTACREQFSSYTGAALLNSIEESKSTIMAISYFKTFCYFYAGLKTILPAKFKSSLGSSDMRASLIEFLRVYIESILIYRNRTTILTQRGANCRAALRRDINYRNITDAQLNKI